MGFGGWSNNIYHKRAFLCFTMLGPFWLSKTLLWPKRLTARGSLYWFGNNCGFNFRLESKLNCVLETLGFCLLIPPTFLCFNPNAFYFLSIFEFLPLVSRHSPRFQHPQKWKELETKRNAKCVQGATIRFFGFNWSFVPAHMRTIISFKKIEGPL